MNIYLSVNNRKQLMKLPILPEEINVKTSRKNETFTTIHFGELLLLGEAGLKELELEAFFPKSPKSYSFAREKKRKGWDCVKLIESWAEKELPVRVTVTGTNINMLMGIESFEYGVQDGTGDIYYTLNLTEYKKVKLKTVKKKKKRKK